MRTTVSKGFLERLEILLPGLKKKLEYKRFMRCLIFGPKDIATGLPLIDSYHIAKALNQVASFRSRNFTGKPFLEEFRREVMSLETFSWSGWDYQEGKARIAYITFPEEIQTLITKELTNTSNKDRVYFDTGLAVTRARTQAQRELMRVEAETYFELAIPEAKPLLHYMNNLPTHNFTKVIDKNWDAAWSKVSQIEDFLSFSVQVEIMMTLRESVQPFYKPSHRGRTPRIFPCNYSIPMLRRDIRKIITRGWYEFDLANAQLAIVSKLWNIQPIQEFLSTKQSIWPELFSHFHLSHLKTINDLKYQGIKAVFKTALYSLIYGMPKGNLTREINQGLKAYGISQGGKHFFNHPLIQALYVARESKFQEMNELTEITTIFDRTLQIEGSKTAKGKPSQVRKDSIASHLAHQAQSVELYVLLPVVELASTTKDFYITLWQHDGFSLHFTDKSKVKYWIPKILKVVQEKIDEQGILTYLEWEENSN